MEAGLGVVACLLSLGFVDFVFFSRCGGICVCVRRCFFLCVAMVLIFSMVLL